MFILFINWDQLKKEFLALDLDGNSNISLSELDSLLRSVKRQLRMSDNEISKLVNETDQDEDGTIGIEEFLNMIEIDNIEGRSNKRDIIHKAFIKRADARKAYEEYDTDGNGFITRDEFKLICEYRYPCKLTSEEIDELMNGADKDQSGRIDYEEFIKAFLYERAKK